MKWTDQLRFCLLALWRIRFRTFMLLLSMSIGVASVVILNGLGEGARQFVLGEFAALGKDVLVLLPGRKETTGGLPPITGGSTRDVTLEDSDAIARLTSVTKLAPVVIGSVSASYDGARRETIVVGTSTDYFPLRSLEVSRGSVLPENQSSGVVVIGYDLGKELFQNATPLGKWLRVGDSRFRVHGVLSDSGGAFGMDIGNIVFIPVKHALRLFNTQGLFRVVIQVRPDTDLLSATEQIENLMKERHHGELDVTLISPDALLSTFDDILIILTAAVTAIGSISLFVAGVLIMNVMLISISQRTREIGLLMSLGASTSRIRMLFLTESGLIALGGAILGVFIGVALLTVADHIFPEFGFKAPIWSLATAVSFALVLSLLFSWLPASKAAKLEPVAALNQR